MANAPGPSGEPSASGSNPKQSTTYFTSPNSKGSKIVHVLENDPHGEFFTACDSQSNVFLVKILKDSKVPNGLELRSTYKIRDYLEDSGVVSITKLTSVTKISTAFPLITKEIKDSSETLLRRRHNIVTIYEIREDVAEEAFVSVHGKVIKVVC